MAKKKFNLLGIIIGGLSGLAINDILFRIFNNSNFINKILLDGIAVFSFVSWLILGFGIFLGYKYIKVKK